MTSCTNVFALSDEAAQSLCELQKQATWLGYTLIHRKPSEFVLQTRERLRAWLRIIQSQCGNRILAIIDDPGTLQKLADLIGYSKVANSAAMYVGPNVMRSAASLIPLTARFLEETLGEEPRCPICMEDGLLKIPLMQCPTCGNLVCYKCIHEVMTVACTHGKTALCPLCRGSIQFGT